MYININKCSAVAVLAKYYLAKCWLLQRAPGVSLWALAEHRNFSLGLFPRFFPSAFFLSPFILSISPLIQI